jgi:hypothetical protein
MTKLITVSDKAHEDLLVKKAKGKYKSFEKLIDDLIFVATIKAEVNK